MADHYSWEKEYGKRMHTQHPHWDEMTAEERGRVEDSEDKENEETSYASED